MSDNELTQEVAVDAMRNFFREKPLVIFGTGANNDKLIRAYSLLTALRQNTSGDSINEYNGLTTSHVNQFHTILSSISSLGIDVSEFEDG